MVGATPANGSRGRSGAGPFRSVLDFDDDEAALCAALRAQLELDDSDWVLPPAAGAAPGAPRALPVPEEARRLAVLRSYRILGTGAEPALDRLTEAVRATFDVPWACVSLIDLGRQCIQSFERRDIAVPREMPRRDALCARCILQDTNSVLVVKDLLQDDRFNDSHLVSGTKPGFRFYAAAPLVSPEGATLGTLCLLDKDPRPQGLTAQEQEELLGQARAIMALLVDRKHRLSPARKRSESPAPTSPCLEPRDKKCCEMPSDLILSPRLDAPLPDPATSVLSPDEYLVELTQAMYGIKLRVRAALELENYFQVITEEQMSAYNMEIVSACRQNDVAALRAHCRAHGRDALDCYNRFGEGLLNLSCRRGFREIVEFLLSDEVGLPVRTRDDFGRSPLHDACWHPEPQLDICRWLMARDAGLFLVADKRGFTPFQYARQSDWPVWRAFLFENRGHLATVVADPAVLRQFL